MPPLDFWFKWKNLSHLEAVWKQNPRSVWFFMPQPIFSVALFIPGSVVVCFSYGDLPL